MINHWKCLRIRICMRTFTPSNTGMDSKQKYPEIGSAYKASFLKSCLWYFAKVAIEIADKHPDAAWKENISFLNCVFLFYSFLVQNGFFYWYVIHLTVGTDATFDCGVQLFHLFGVLHLGSLWHPAHPSWSKWHWFPKKMVFRFLKVKGILRSFIRATGIRAFQWVFHYTKKNYSSTRLIWNPNSIFPCFPANPFKGRGRADWTPPSVLATPCQSEWDERDAALQNKTKTPLFASPCAWH